MAFTLPDLSYDYGALDKSIDAQTMEIHHTKHHQAYITNANNAMEGTALEGKSVEDIMAMVSSQSPAVRNNAGGHFNHSLFWTVLGPDASGEPSGDLASDIENTFDGFDNFKSQFNTAAATRFGSGWAWLVVNGEGKLEVCSTPNQDNPLMDDAPVKGTPVLGVDVWEHAYYLRYQNRRPDYMTAIWDVINWEEVAKRYALAK